MKRLSTCSLGAVTGIVILSSFALIRLAYAAISLLPTITPSVSNANRPIYNTFAAFV